MKLSLSLKSNRERRPGQIQDDTVLDLVARFTATPPEDHNDLIVIINLYGPYLEVEEESKVIVEVRKLMKNQIRTAVYDKNMNKNISVFMIAQANILLRSAFDEMFRAELRSVKDRGEI